MHYTHFGGQKIYVDCWSSNFLSLLAFPIKIPDRLRGKKIAKYFSLIWCGLVEKEKVVIGQVSWFQPRD